MAGESPNYPQNPWIVGECHHWNIAPAPIDTGVQPMFAQCAEDYLLESMLRADLRRQARPMSSISYLDIGANHPVQTSNTYLFYAKHGCCGVLVEPNADLLPAITKVRPRDRLVHAAVAPRGVTSLQLNISRHHELSSASIEHMRHFGELGTVEKTTRVPAILLDDLLRECFNAPVDILSLDIEGLDLAVLSDSRLEFNTPRYIVVEHDRDVIPGNDQRILEHLSNVGYVLICETDVNFVLRLNS